MESTFIKIGDIFKGKERAERVLERLHKEKPWLWDSTDPRFIPGPKCEACLDSGYNYNKKDICDCSLESDVAHFLCEAIPNMVGDDYIAHTFDNMERKTKMLLAAAMYLENKEKGTSSYEAGCNLTLCGSPGNGKTATAVCLMKAIADMYPSHIYGIVYVAWPAWTSQYVRTEYGHQTNKINRLKNARFLILDDYGREHHAPKSPFIHETFSELIDYRYRFKSPTMICTNHSKEEYLASMENHTASRLSQAGRSGIFDGGDQQDMRCNYGK